MMCECKLGKYEQLESEWSIGRVESGDLRDVRECDVSRLTYDEYTVYSYTAAVDL